MSEYQLEDEGLAGMEAHGAHERLDLLARNVEAQLGLLEARVGALEVQRLDLDRRLSLLEETLRDREVDLPPQAQSPATTT